MDNILELDPLEEAKTTLEKVEFMAKALAYGVLEGKWSLVFSSSRLNDEERWLLQSATREQSREFELYLDKWNEQKPQAALLMSFGYLGIIRYTPNQNNPVYQLTEKAFDLLKAPSRERQIFISYRRDSSSAFGLLIVSRLQAVGIQNPFIDMNLDTGDMWEEVLETRVRNCDIFIALITPTALESEFVQKEIAWAFSVPTVKIIPIWHGNFDLKTQKNYPAELAKIQPIIVEKESAEHYNTAVVKLLNYLGYAP